MLVHAPDTSSPVDMRRGCCPTQSQGEGQMGHPTMTSVFLVILGREKVEGAPDFVSSVNTAKFLVHKVTTLEKREYKK